VRIGEFRARLSELLDRVSSGSVVIIEYYGRPKGVLLPYERWKEIEKKLEETK